MTKFGTLLVAAVLSMVVGASPALAQHGGGGHGGGGGGWLGGGWHGGGWHGGGWHNRFFFGFGVGVGP